MSNPYLEGNFRPVEVEQTATDLAVTGRIPPHLDGRYLRIGPNPITAPDPARYHWFTGTGMVHGVRLREGRAEWYRNRYVRSDDVAVALGEPPRPGPKHAGLDFAANTNVISHGGRTLAIVEAGTLPYELSDDLDTVARCDFAGTLDGSYTAHPLLDPATGELHAVSYYWGWGNRVQYTVVGPDGRVRRAVDIEVGQSPMMHSFALTETAVIIFDLPVVFDLARAQASSFPYGWDPAYPARVGVLPREGGPDDVRWLEIEPCYVFHPLNAYDDGDTIVIDVVRHPRMFDTEARGPNDGPPTLDRWTIDRTAGKVLEERLDDRPIEFPRIDERLAGRRHRYGYSVTFTAAGASTPAPSALVKHDLIDGTSSVRSFGSRTSVGEFVFAPSDPSAAEDDGVLMGLVYDGDGDRSSLQLLDAGTLETIAAVHLPSRVPEGFHGNWLRHRESPREQDLERS